MTAFTHFVDSFRRPDSVEMFPQGFEMTNTKGAVVFEDSSKLSRSLRSRHLSMIAIGGSIGTGLLVSSGTALATSGPASLLIGFALVGFLLYCTIQALGELSTQFPVSGSFSTHSTRFLDPSWGFAMGWNYALQWLCVLPLEIVAATLTLNYWNPGLNNSGFVALFLLIIVGANLFGVKGYAEVEFLSSIIKVAAVIGFDLFAIVANTGGTPTKEYIGGLYWRNPGAFNNGFKGFCSVLVTAAFSYAGAELIGLAAAETKNPRKSLPRAAKQVFWRITLFYIITLFLVGLLVPWDDPRLLIGKSSADANASPLVIAIHRARVQVLPSIINVVILVAVLSVGNTSVYGSSRTLLALAENNHAPKAFRYIDRNGRPLVGIAFASLFGLIAFIATSNRQEVVFQWLLSISGLSIIFTWASICMCHIRFRAAWAEQGHSLSELPFTAQFGVVGSWIGLIMNIFILVMQFWLGCDPIEKMSAGQRVEEFFSTNLALPFVLICYVGHKLIYRTSFVRTYSMDTYTGIRDLNLAELIEEEQKERATWSTGYRIWRFLC